MNKQYKLHNKILQTMNTTQWGATDGEAIIQLEVQHMPQQ